MMDLCVTSIECSVECVPSGSLNDELPVYVNPMCVFVHSNRVLDTFYPRAVILAPGVRLEHLAWESLQALACFLRFCWIDALTRKIFSFPKYFVSVGTVCQ